MVKGSQRLPSCVRNQPLKSIPHTSLAAATELSGDGDGNPRCRRLRRRTRPCRSRIRPIVLSAGQRSPGTSRSRTKLQFLRSPSRVLDPHRHNRCLDLFAHRMRMMMRCPTPVLQSVNTFRHIPLDQLVTGLPAHPEFPADLRDRLLPGLPFSDKHQAFVHHMGLFPGHRRLLPDDPYCYPCPRIDLSPMFPVHTQTPPLPIGRGLFALVSRRRT
jgi:hypothetical protein